MKVRSFPASSLPSSIVISSTRSNPIIVAFVDEDVVADLPGDNVELRPSGFRCSCVASGLFCERVEGRLALVLCRLVSRHMGLRPVLVRLRFLFFLISFLSL